MEKNKRYPNKEDYEKNIYAHAENPEELPLADPAESNATKVFRDNEAKEDEGDNKPSAFSENKEE